MRHRPAKDKPPRLDAGHLVNLLAGKRLHQLIHRLPERARIAEQGGDIAKDDPGLGIIGNGANGVDEIHGSNRLYDQETERGIEIKSIPLYFKTTTIKIRKTVYKNELAIPIPTCFQKLPEFSMYLAAFSIRSETASETINGFALSNHDISIGLQHLTGFTSKSAKLGW